jgi:hypothetical protein
MARNSKGLHHHYLTSAAADDAAGWVEGISALDESHPATALMLADAVPHPTHTAAAAAAVNKTAAPGPASSKPSSSTAPVSGGDTAPAGALTPSPGGKDTTSGSTSGAPGDRAVTGGAPAGEVTFQSQLDHELDLMALEVGSRAWGQGESKQCKGGGVGRHEQRSVQGRVGPLPPDPLTNTAHATHTSMLTFF